MKKILALALSLALAVAIGIGGTLAWLTAETKAVANTFTVGNIDITLEETETNFKMVPGQIIKKDPLVTVKAGSEACWLFVKVEESEDLKDFINYDIDITGGWTKLTDAAGVYYRKVLAHDNPQEFHVIGYTDSDNKFQADKVLVSSEVTKEMMDGLKDNIKPTLTFTAYAVQSAGFENEVAKAWGQVQPATPTAP